MPPVAAFGEEGADEHGGSADGIGAIRRQLWRSAHAFTADAADEAWHRENAFACRVDASESRRVHHAQHCLRAAVRKKVGTRGALLPGAGQTREDTCLVRGRKRALIDGGAAARRFIAESGGEARGGIFSARRPPIAFFSFRPRCDQRR